MILRIFFAALPLVLTKMIYNRRQTGKETYTYMKKLIVYGSRYGSSRLYAHKLSAETGIGAVNYEKVTDLSDIDTVIYVGGLYAGGILGLSKTLAKGRLKKSASLIIVTVGLSDPRDPKTSKNIITSVKRSLPNDLCRRASFFHLRGGIDYSRLSPGHKAMMSLLCFNLKRRPAGSLSPEDREFLRTYGKSISFMDFSYLEPIIDAVDCDAGVKSAV